MEKIQDALHTLKQPLDTVVQRRSNIPPRWSDRLLPPPSTDDLIFDKVLAQNVHLVSRPFLPGCQGWLGCFSNIRKLFQTAHCDRSSVSLYFCLSRVCNVRRPLVYFELHRSESVFHHSRGPFEHSLGNNTSNLTSVHTPAVDVGVGLHFLTVTSDLIHRLFADLRHLQLSKKMNPALKVLDDALKNRPIPSSFDAVKGAPEAERSSVVNENIPNITATDRATILTAWKNAVQGAGPAQGATAIYKISSIVSLLITATCSRLKMNPALKILDDALKNRPIPSSFDAVKGAPEAERSSVVNENIPNITATDRATILTAWKNAVQDAGPGQGATPTGSSSHLDQLIDRKVAEKMGEFMSRYSLAFSQIWTESVITELELGAPKRFKKALIVDRNAKSATRKGYLKCQMTGEEHYKGDVNAAHILPEQAVAFLPVFGLKTDDINSV
ncbi:hypothetical protein PROFUN_16876, partial [Planoprotostelium fungivorum]